MLTVQVCVGSSCFLRGSKNVIEEIKKLITRYKLDDKVILKGSFCHDKCTGGVTITIGEKLFTGIEPKDTGVLFEKEILPIVKEEHDATNNNK